MNVNFPSSSKISIKVGVPYHHYDDFMKKEKEEIIESINKNCFETS